MDYNRFLNAEDIPIIRRLDYIVKDTDGFESGKLYAALRKMSTLEIYNDNEITEERKSAEYEFKKDILIPKLEWVNQWMEAHGKDVIFTDLQNYTKIGDDYDYFWNLRTEKDFVKEEAEARLGISGRKPVENNLEKLEEEINKKMEQLKNDPSLEEK